MAVYLELFHGRNSITEQLGDWGSEGPILGPLAFVHTTYGADIKIETVDGQSGVLSVLGEEAPDLLYYDKIYYGDWSVFSDDTLLKNEGLAHRVQQFETARATLPSADSLAPDAQLANSDARKVEWHIQVPVLSTAHVQQSTLGQLAGMRPRLVADYPEGAFIHIGAVSLEELADIPELLSLAEWFQKNYPDEKWLRLDKDGDRVEGLTQYQW